MTWNPVSRASVLAMSVETMTAPIVPTRTVMICIAFMATRKRVSGMNMKTRTNKPGEDATSAAADVLMEFDRLREALALTHTQIPDLLASERNISRQLGLNAHPQRGGSIGLLVSSRCPSSPNRPSALVLKRRVALVAPCN
jgi:hypothetical protein